MRQCQNVLEKVAIGVRIRAVDDHMRAVDQWGIIGTGERTFSVTHQQRKFEIPARDNLPDGLARRLQT
jgi:hypothetical protein